jgi:HEAT repeat protein
MQPNLSDTGTLLNAVAKSANWWRRFFESQDAEEIHQIIAELSPLDLAVLDQRARGYSAYGYFRLHNWENLRRSDVGRLAQSRFATSLVGLSSFHFNGHVREAAVEELASHRSGKELPFLLIRLNDWVSQIRDAAARAVRVRIEPAYAVHFLANIGLVLRLNACGRAEKQLVEDVRVLLKRPEGKKVLRAGMASKDRTVRRTSFRLAAEADPTARSSLIRAVLTDPDAVARSWAARHFLPDVSPEELPELAGTMLADRFMPVRRDALWAVATKRPDLAVEPLQRALLDSHRSMREMALHFLVVAGIEDVREFYAEAIQKGAAPTLFSAICGLGETGKASDVASVATHLHSPRPKLRRAAAYAVGKLDAASCVAALTDLLADPKASVSREALKALCPVAGLIPLRELEQMLESKAGSHVRRNALTLILRTDKWRKVPALLTACSDEEAKIAGMAANALRDWLRNYNRSFVEPTRTDLERIQTVLSKVEAKLPDSAARELRFCLAIYSR